MGIGEERRAVGTQAAEVGELQAQEAKDKEEEEEEGLRGRLRVFYLNRAIFWINESLSV